MLKRAWFILFIGILPLLGWRTAAQAPASDWAVTIFDLETVSLQVITASGLQAGPALPDLSAYGEVRQMQVTPDERFAVFQGDSSSAVGYAYYVADLTTGNCCVVLQDPNQSNLALAILGPFSPDGSQVAASLFDPSTFGESQTITSFMVVFDLATGVIVASQPLAALQPEDPWAAVALYGEWKADGIRAVPSCYGCEGLWEGQYRLWNPETNTVSAPVEPFDIFMNRLPGTGEVLKSVANPAYPQNGGPAAYFPIANVVEYYRSIHETEGQVIYFNPDNPNIESADWVADGRAIAVKIGGTPTSQPDNPMGTQDNSSAYLLFRDGHQVNIQPDLGYVLAGTPDGWIAMNWSNGSAALVTLDANDVPVVTALGTHNRWEVAATNFTVGATAAPGPFPPVTKPERVTCPGFMASRLWANTFARVTPGEPNNLRAEATTSSALVGKVPGGETVAVLFGPVCGENMTWWQVEYLGQTGWTVEGQGSQYWMEPIGDNF